MKRGVAGLSRNMSVCNSTLTSSIRSLSSSRYSSKIRIIKNTNLHSGTFMNTPASQHPMMNFTQYCRKITLYLSAHLRLFFPPVVLGFSVQTALSTVSWTSLFFWLPLVSGTQLDRAEMSVTHFYTHFIVCIDLDKRQIPKWKCHQCSLPHSFSKSMHNATFNRKQSFQTTNTTM